MPDPIESALVRHPASSAPAVSALRARCKANEAGLRLEYVLEGDIAALLIPPSTQPAFTDGLWRHTCFEAFIATPDGTRYREFNFSPSGEWAAYTFTDYRERDTHWRTDAAPRISVHAGARQLTLQALIPAALLPAGECLLGITAVIESADGSISYWALKHCSDRPDFHQRAAWTLPLSHTSPDTRTS